MERIGRRTVIAMLVLTAVALFITVARAEGPAPGTTFKDCDDCPEMVVIPKGRYVMGVPRGEEQRYRIGETGLWRSEPMTEIILAKNFAFGKFHVTRGQFAAFVKETNWDFPDNKGCWDAYGKPLAQTDDLRRQIGRNHVQPDFSWANPGYAQDDRHPVACVAWVDIRAYLAWLSKKAGHTYRLPSESEWEYVARAGTTTATPWGEANEETCKYANVADLSRAKAHALDPSPQYTFQCDDGFPDTAPVGSFPANPFGVHDMFGNLWQVTEDCFEYALDNIPRDGSPLISDTSKPRDKNIRISNPLLGPIDVCDLRTARGGSFDIFPNFVRSGYRSRFELWRADSGNGRFNYEGFRVARDLR